MNFISFIFTLILSFSLTTSFSYANSQSSSIAPAKTATLRPIASIKPLNIISPNDLVCSSECVKVPFSQPKIPAPKPVETIYIKEFSQNSPPFAAAVDKQSTESKPNVENNSNVEINVKRHSLLYYFSWTLLTFGSTYIVLYYPKQIGLPRWAIRRTVQIRQRIRKLLLSLLNFLTVLFTNFDVSSLKFDLKMILPPWMYFEAKQPTPNVEWDFESLHSGPTGKDGKSKGKKTGKSGKLISENQAKDKNESGMNASQTPSKAEKRRKNRTQSARPKVESVTPPKSPEISDAEPGLVPVSPAPDVQLKDSIIIGYTAPSSRAPSDDEDGFMTVIPSARRRNPSYNSLRSGEFVDAPLAPLPETKRLDKRSNTDADHQTLELSRTTSNLQLRHRHPSVESWMSIASSATHQTTQSLTPSTALFTPQHRPPSPPLVSAWGSKSTSSSTALNSPEILDVEREHFKRLSIKESNRNAGEPRKTRRNKNSEIPVVSSKSEKLVPHLESDLSPISDASSPTRSPLSPSKSLISSSPIQKPQTPPILNGLDASGTNYYSPFGTGFNFGLRRNSDASFESYSGTNNSPTNPHLASVIISEEFKNLLNSNANILQQSLSGNYQWQQAPLFSNSNQVPVIVNDHKPKRPVFEQVDTNFTFPANIVSPTLLSPPATPATKRNFGLLPKRGKSDSESTEKPLAIPNGTKINTLPPNSPSTISNTSIPTSPTSWSASAFGFLRGKPKGENDESHSTTHSDDDIASKIPTTLEEDAGANTSVSFLTRLGFMGGSQKKKDRKSVQLHVNDDKGTFSGEESQTAEDMLGFNQLHSQMSGQPAPVTQSERDSGLLSRIIGSNTTAKKQHQQQQVKEQQQQKEQQFQQQQHLLEQMQQQISLILQHQQLLMQQQQNASNGFIPELSQSNQQIMYLQQQMASNGFSPYQSQHLLNGRFVPNQSQPMMTTSRIPGMQNARTHFANNSSVSVNSSYSNVPYSASSASLHSRQGTYNHQASFSTPALHHQIEDPVDKIWDEMGAHASLSSRRNSEIQSISTRSVSPVSRRSRRSVGVESRLSDNKSWQVQDQWPNSTQTNVKWENSNANSLKPEVVVNETIKTGSSPASGSSSTSSMRKRFGFGSTKRKEDESGDAVNSLPQFTQKSAKERAATIRNKIAQLSQSPTQLLEYRIEVHNALKALNERKMSPEYVSSTNTDDRTRDFYQEQHMNDELEALNRAISKLFDNEGEKETKDGKPIFALPWTAFGTKSKKVTNGLSSPSQEHISEEIEKDVSDADDTVVEKEKDKTEKGRMLGLSRLTMTFAATKKEKEKD
ncbi:hypothetical protein HK098_006112 [Nowakowskiella sp. JEL0407]|nr:hypothetical protein HK098_006112 [Nowakowskiella sp. JEL0407]